MNKFFSASLIWIASIVSILLIQLVGSIILLTVPPEANMIVQYVVMALVQIANVLIVVTIRKKRGFVSPYMPKRPTAILIVKSVVLGLLTFVGMYMVSQYVFEFLESIGVRASYLDINGWYIIPAVLVTVILAPIGEEAVFRCSLTYGLNNGKAIIAVMLSAIAFALMHMSPMQTFYQFALGVILAVLIMRSQNVIYPIIAHATSNLAVIIFSFVQLPQIPLFNILTIILSLLIFVISLFLVFIIMKTIKTQNSISCDKQINDTKEDRTLGVVVFVLGILVCLSFWISAFF